MNSIRLPIAYAVGNAAVASRVSGRAAVRPSRALMMRIYPGYFKELLVGKRIGVISGIRQDHHDAPADRSAAGLGGRSARCGDQCGWREPARGGGLRDVHASEGPDCDSRGRRAGGARCDRLRPSRGADHAELQPDQLDRHHEINVGKKWRKALIAAGEQGPTVVANAKDPLVTWSAEAARKVIWVDMSTGWTQDAALCPQCGTILEYDCAGHWNCPGCPLGEHQPDYRVEGGEVIEADGERWPLDLQVPGRFNQGNAACALRAVEMGVYEPIAARDADRQAPAGRFAIGSYGDTRARLVLKKRGLGGVVAGDGNRPGDPGGRFGDRRRHHVRLWDVEYEKLRGRRVIARAQSHRPGTAVELCRGPW